MTTIGKSTISCTDWQNGDWHSNGQAIKIHGVIGDGKSTSGNITIKQGTTTLIVIPISKAAPTSFKVPIEAPLGITITQTGSGNWSLLYSLQPGSYLPSIYLGQISGQLMQPQALILAASATQIMSRKVCYARSAVTAVKVRFPNYYMDTSLVETGSGNTITVTAAIEYPLGSTCTQILWSGLSSQDIADASIGAESDWCAVTIPKGAKFAIRSYTICTVAFPVQQRIGCSDSAFNSGSFRFALAGLSDQTMTPGVPTGGTNSANFMYQPIVVVGKTFDPSVLIIGDSRQEGNAASESYADTSGDIGQIPRSVGQRFAYTNLGKGSDRLTFFLASGTLRTSLASYFSHVISAYGVNDIYVGGAADTVYNNIKTVRQAFPNQKFFQLRIATETTSTDSWATVANQSVISGNVARIQVNNKIATSDGIDGYFDTLPIEENIPNSDGKWVVNGVANYATSDGVHQSTALNKLIANSGAIDLNRITR